MRWIPAFALLLAATEVHAEIQIDFDPALLPVNGVVLDVVAEIGQAGEAENFSSSITGPSGQPAVWHAVWNLDEHFSNPTPVQSMTVHIDCGGELVLGTYTPEEFTVFYHPGPLLPPSELTEFEELDPEQVCEAVSVDEPAQHPESFGLQEVWPNPFNPSARVSFQLPSAALTRLEVYDLRGAMRQVLLEEELSAGTHELVWDPAELASGLYILHLSSGDLEDQQKAILMR